MMNLNLPQGRIPLGYVTVAGQRLPVEIDPEWMRALSVVVDRSGGVTGAGSFPEVAAWLLQPPASSPDAQEALRAADELRNELASVRGELTVARSALEDLAATVVAWNSPPDLTGRVQQLEDRLA